MILSIATLSFSSSVRCTTYKQARTRTHTAARALGLHAPPEDKGAGTGPGGAYVWGALPSQRASAGSAGQDNDKKEAQSNAKPLHPRAAPPADRLQTGMPAEKGDSSAVGGEKPEQEAKGVKEEDTDTDCTARAAVLRLKVHVDQSPLYGDFSILVYLHSRTARTQKRLTAASAKVLNIATFLSKYARALIFQNCSVSRSHLVLVGLIYPCTRALLFQNFC
jgi:hypothetical protein